MHRQRKIPAFAKRRPSLVTTRSSSSAAKLKEDPSSQLGKWARPSQSTAVPQGWSRPSQGAGWGRPAPPQGAGQAQRWPTAGPGQAQLGKWEKPQADTHRTSQSNSNGRPRQTSGGWNTIKRAPTSQPRASTSNGEASRSQPQDRAAAPGWSTRQPQSDCISRDQPVQMPRDEGWSRIRRDQTRDEPPHTAQAQSTAESGDPRTAQASQRTQSSAALPSESVDVTSDVDVVELEGEQRSASASAEPTPIIDVDEDAFSATHSRHRKGHKGRGSLIAQLEREENERPAGRARSQQQQQKLELKRAMRKAVVEKRVSPDVYIPSSISVGRLATLLHARLDDLVRVMREAGMAEEAKYDHVLTSEYAALIAQEYGRNPIVNDEAAFDIYPPPPHPEPHTLPTRPPVVTIMGHVDHGKTTLLDTLRSSSVAKGEAGGITQHIGAFSVPVPHAMRNSESGPKTITFLDTPGHAAFSAMRARGAQVTDIVVLVVAADDGIMPQTREVLDLVKRDSNVNLVVAINKCDKPEADVDRVQKQLMEVGIQLESMGGDIPSVEVSGLTGKGLPDLVDTLSAIAEVKDIRAEDDGPVQGYVLESRMQKGLGATATVLVLRGCLKPGALVICGTHQAKVRVMQDDAGKPVKSAGPGSAVVVTGWKSLPSAGEEVLQATSESEIKRAIANRERQADIESALADVEVINAARRAERERRAAEADLDDDAVRALERERAREEDGQKSLRLIIKADVSGSAEAVAGALVGIGNDKAATKIIASEVGEVSESDVTRAKISGAAVVAFNVKTPRPIQMLADREGVPIISSPIIYRLMEDVRGRVIDLLPKIIETRVIGEANVVQLFDISMKGKVTKKIAGCRVSNGVLQKDKLLRVIRNGTTVYEEGSLDTMRHHKSDVMEVRKGIECGLNISGYDDLREGDMIQMFERVEKPGIL